MFMKFNVVWGTRLCGAAGWCGWRWWVVAPPVVVVLMVLVHVSQRGLYVRYELRHSVTANETMAGQGAKLTTIYGSSSRTTESCEVLADSRAGNVPVGSTRSLPVVREQYCQCSPNTKLEKRLVIAVVILSLVTVLLLIAISVLAERETTRSVKDIMKSLLPKF